MSDSEPSIQSEELPEELLRHSILLFEDEDLELSNSGDASPHLGQEIVELEADSLQFPMLEEQPRLTYHQEVKREIAHYLQQRHLVVEKARKLAACREQCRERIIHPRPVKRPDAAVLRALAPTVKVSERQRHPERIPRSRTPNLPLGSIPPETGKVSGQAHSKLKSKDHPKRDFLQSGLDLKLRSKRVYSDERADIREGKEPDKFYFISRKKNSAQSPTTHRSVAPPSTDFFRVSKDHPHTGRRPPSPMDSQMSISFDKNLKRSSNILFSMELTHE